MSYPSLGLAQGFSFDLAKLLEFLVLSECVIIAIIFVLAIFSSLENGLEFLHLLIHFMTGMQTCGLLESVLLFCTSMYALFKNL
jgi:hypothetical protein